LIIRSKNFNIQQIADSGQCFRMNKISTNKYSLISYGKYIELTQLDNEHVEINCSIEDYEQTWKEYFDLDYDYSVIVDTLIKGKDEFLKQAANFGSGLRIVRQEPFEALISFIISQNKNIPAIKRSIEKLSKQFGELKINNKCGGVSYYSFPTPDALANADKESLRQAGIGYRDKYVIEASQAVLNGTIKLTDLKKCEYEKTLKKLKSLCGVGDKVASCIALYGLHNVDAVPVDVWIARVLREIYNNEFNWDKYKGYAGIVQQYMFYYIRNTYRIY
jgi:N-glycosylase/DNA lyase